jgi:hypothetical protein
MKAMLVYISAALLSLALPAIAHSQRATDASVSCVIRFPYKPEQFLEKFLTVAEETDPYTVPEKFKLAFHMKLPTAVVSDPLTFSYDATACEWYTRVHIGSPANLKLSRAARVVVIVGDLLHPLRFGDPQRDECLSSEVANNQILEDGWKGGPLESAIITWVYGRDHALLQFLANGSKAPNGVACVTEMAVYYD